MNLLKKSTHLAGILALTLSFFLVVFASAAIAAPSNFADAVAKCVLIADGAFSVKAMGPVPSQATVTSAVVSLPPNEAGIIKEIAITGPDGQKEFGCQNLKVQNGTDLIKACGGPAVLKAGDTTYQASGSNFGPDTTSILSVTLDLD